MFSREPFSLRSFLPVAAGLLMLPAAPLHAADDQLDAVTVTASRYERPLSTTPAAVTVLEADDLAPWTALPLENILAAQGGVTFARSGGPGQQTSLFLRGTDSDSVLLLVDGVKVNGATFGGANLQNLRGADIERIEIVRGPRSTLYGSEAIGGVIAVTTRRAGSTAGTDSARDEVFLRGERGSDDTAAVHAAAASDRGDDHLAIGIGDFRTDGDPILAASPVAGAHRNTSGTFNAATRRGDTRFGIDALVARGSTRYIDTFSLTERNQTFDNSAANLWSDTGFGESLSLRTRVGHATDDIDQQESVDFAHTRRLSGSVELQHRQETLTLIGGVDAEREHADASIYGTATDEKNDSRALFLHGDWTFGRQQFSLGGRETDYDSFGRHGTGEASWGLRFGNTAFGWLAWGRGFRAPDAIERFGYGGNPDLEPETGDSYEAGLRQRFGTHQLTLTGFRQDIDDLIVCVALPPPSWDCVLQNIDSARITGTELAWSWHGTATHLEAQLTLQDPVDAGTGERLSRRPEKQLSAAARHRIGAVELRTLLLHMDERDNSAFDNIRLPSFTVVDIGAAWTVRPGLVLDARVENVGDREYALASSSAGDYRMPDRAFFLGFEWRAGKTWSP
ncbi:MAG: TonB-dependent receptor domain-containing protein [Pseudomonadota bacterium]